MQLMVKTLKGGKFDITVEESQTIGQVKGIIESIKSELPAGNTKLIHSGKVLKDDDTVGSCGIKANDFLVVMITKAKKTVPPAASADAAATTTKAAEMAATPPAGDSEAPAATGAAATTTTTTPMDTTTSTTTTSTADSSNTTPAVTTSTPSAVPSPDDAVLFPVEAVQNLIAMGFPEAEVRHCLQAAHGNPDIAVEFLTNGIPDGVADVARVMSSSSSLSAGTLTTPSTQQSHNVAAGTTTTAVAGGQQQQRQPLQALRNHPQFHALRRLVQSNPQMLQQVLTQIGQQQPELLQEINDNQAIFLQMMNEPVTEEHITPPAAAAATASSQASSSSSSPSPWGTSAAATGLPPGLEAMGNPAQMASLIQRMSPDELTQMSHMMGLTPEQLRATAQMIEQMPAEQLNQFMMQAMGGGFGAGDLGGMGAGFGGPQVLRLTEEEMAAVDRLTELGFDRSEAAQAFLACDKNEALAANLLMDSMGEGGGGFFDGGGPDDGGDNNHSGDNDNNGNDDEDMYD